MEIYATWHRYYTLSYYISHICFGPAEKHGKTKDILRMLTTPEVVPSRLLLRHLRKVIQGKSVPEFQQMIGNRCKWRFVWQFFDMKTTFKSRLAASINKKCPFWKASGRFGTGPDTPTCSFPPEIWSFDQQRSRYRKLGILFEGLALLQKQHLDTFRPSNANKQTSKSSIFFSPTTWRGTEASKIDFDQVSCASHFGTWRSNCFKLFMNH